MKPTFICLSCGQEYERNPRIKEGQQYCNARKCQNERILSWKRKKYAMSEDYRKQCRQWQIDWWKKRPIDKYQKEYRAKNSAYVIRNRELQRQRNHKYRRTSRIEYIKKIVNSNTFRSYGNSGGIYVFIPGKWQKIVNSNALNVTVQLVR